MPGGTAQLKADTAPDTDEADQRYLHMMLQRAHYYTRNKAIGTCVDNPAACIQTGMKHRVEGCMTVSTPKIGKKPLGHGRKKLAV